MFILSSICSSLENHTSIFENSESKVFKNVKFLGEISNNWPKDLLETNAYKTISFRKFSDVLAAFYLYKSYS